VRFSLFLKKSILSVSQIAVFYSDIYVATVHRFALAEGAGGAPAGIPREGSVAIQVKHIVVNAFDVGSLQSASTSCKL
jgi:hypothetical protein